jgi:uncharacterized protein (DUF305 family)
MYKIGLLVLLSTVTLVIGGCAMEMPGGMNPPTGAAGPRIAMAHSPMMTETHAMSATHMSGMDHNPMVHSSHMMSSTHPMTHATMSGMQHGGMTVDPAQPFDAQFIDSMIAHHQGAIAMANEVLAQSERPELRQLAEAVIAAQSQEIEQMTSWRQSWYPELPPTAGLAMGMGEMAISTDERMPFDQRFLEAMIAHHQGAIGMAQMALHQAEHAEIKMLAAAIIAAQTAEIEQMQGWLQEWFGVSAAASPYVAQLASSVRGLSPQEVDDLLAGRGMGFARMAELNHHPGPRHLLDLQTQLQLSPEQVAAIEEIFTQMQAQAQALGAQIVAQEQQLSAAFASGALDEATLEAQVMALADLYGQLRLVHLRAHLQVTPLLSAEQIAAYDELRGYADGAAHHHSMHP